MLIQTCLLLAVLYLNQNAKKFENSIEIVIHRMIIADFVTYKRKDKSLL